MQANTQIIKLIKRYPFTISRGTRTFSQNIFLSLHEDNFVGLGECDPGIFESDELIIAHAKLLQNFLDNQDLTRLSIQEIWQCAQDNSLSRPLQAALDIALWDLLGKKYSLPCFRMFGLSQNSKPTSITLGITPHEHIHTRVNELLSKNLFRALKIKLGSPDGIESDQKSFVLIKKAAQAFDVKLRVDANGGWSLRDAKIMCDWLAKEGVEYVEQPLRAELDEALPELFKTRALPLFIDESCDVSSDIPLLAHCVDGVNIKLMKCGGITEALRMVSTARAHKLKTMIGCMSESSVALSAAGSIAALFDYIDLDSAFNLNPDPALGLSLINGSVVVSNSPGHGACLC